MKTFAKIDLKSILETKHFLPGALLVIILTAVYMVTLLPGVGYHGDTAKFQFVGRVLGTPHSTGYPTYILLNHIFTKFFPFGSLAYKANLLSAIFAVLTCFFLYLTLIRVFAISAIISFIASLSLGMTYTFWSQSIVAEVYTLHSLFLVTVIYSFLSWRQTKKSAFFFIGCFLYAISFGNHLTMLLVLPAIVFIVWNTDKKTFTDIKKVMWVLLFIIIGALQYGYLFWRFYSPDTPYLEMAAPNLEKFSWFISGAQFKSRMFAFSFFEVVTDRIPWFLKQMLVEFLFLSPVAILGVYKMKNNAVNIFLLLIFLGNMGYAVNYNIADISVYLIPNVLIIAIYLGLGLEFLIEIASKKKIGLISYASYTFIIIPVLLFFFNQDKMHHINNTLHAQKVETIITTVKGNALLISPDEFYSQYFWYYLIGEKLEAKRNIFLVHHFDINQVKEYIDNKKPIYLPEQRKYAPAGLNVFCINQDHYNQFRELGYHISKISTHLFKISKKR